MSDHNLSARLWASGALLTVPIASWTGVGWWLPLHMALLGAITQAIVGGQLMFSATLGLARGPSRKGRSPSYNAGLLAVLVGLRASSEIALLGIAMSWIAAAATLAKCWAFPLLARLPSVERQSAIWWADPENTSGA